MLDFLIAVLMIAVLLGVPTMIYVGISQYRHGYRMGERHFKHNHTFPH
jgi:hypothetical protein